MYQLYCIIITKINIMLLLDIIYITRLLKSKTLIDIFSSKERRKVNT